MCKLFCLLLYCTTLSRNYPQHLRNKLSENNLQLYLPVIILHTRTLCTSAGKFFENSQCPCVIIQWFNCWIFLHFYCIGSRFFKLKEFFGKQTRYKPYKIQKITNPTKVFWCSNSPWNPFIWYHGFFKWFCSFFGKLQNQKY